MPSPGPSPGRDQHSWYRRRQETLGTAALCPPTYERRIRSQHTLAVFATKLMSDESHTYLSNVIDHNLRTSAHLPAGLTGCWPKGNDITVFLELCNSTASLITHCQLCVQGERGLLLRAFHRCAIAGIVVAPASALEVA